MRRSPAVAPTLRCLLIQRGAEVNAADSGHTPLHIAAENGNAAVVESLLTHGADAHAVDAEDKTPLSPRRRPEPFGDRRPDQRVRA